MSNTRRRSRGLWGISGSIVALLLGCAHGGLPPVSEWEQAETDLRTGRGEQARVTLEAMHRKSPRNYAVARALVEAHSQAGSAAALADRLSGASTPVEHYMRALALFAQVRDVTAEVRAEFDKTIDADPKKAEPRYRLGVALLEANRPDEALEPLRRASELAPYRRSIYLPLAQVLFKTGDASGAVAALTRMVSLGPNLDEVTKARAMIGEKDPFAAMPAEVRGDFERGLQALERDQPAEALSAFDAVIAARPELSAGHLLRGLSLQRAGDFGGAAEALRHADTLDPSQALSELYLGNLLWGQAQPDAAAKKYAEAIAQNPLLDEAYLRQGELAMERRDLELARRSFKALTFLTPEDLGVRRSLAETLRQQGDFEGAERELRVALGYAPDHVELRLRLAQLYADEGQKSQNPSERQRHRAQARREAQRVLELEPENPAAVGLIAANAK